jgi:mannose-6-phosphate isomerase-like protein (cupin superfamily)
MRRITMCGAAMIMMAAMATAALTQTTAEPVPEKAGSGIDRRSEESIAAQAKSMLADARTSSGGIASVTLEKYPGHYTMLTVRTKSGGAEMHAEWSDIFFILDGEATEITGGTIVNPTQSASGETRGARVEGGTSTPMRRGDVIHISPNTPHQIILTPGKTFSYYVIKVAAPKQ